MPLPSPLRRFALISAVVAAAGLIGLAMVRAPLMLLAAISVGGLGGLIVWVVAVGLNEPPPSFRAQARARTRAWSLAGIIGLAILVVSGMAVVLGDATGPVLLVAAALTAACSWSRTRAAVTRFRARERAQPAGDPETTSDDAVAAARPDASVLETLGTVALCALWQRSYHQLHEVRDEAARDTLVTLRRRCLGEFERRDPTGIARWLATEPRPAGNGPHRHLGAAPSPERSPGPEDHQGDLRP